MTTVVGINKLNETINIITKDSIISFTYYSTDTTDKIIQELIQENFKFTNINFLKACINCMLNPRFKSIE
jgi:hypothetical protein